jgi:hypothetical protein
MNCFRIAIRRDREEMVKCSNGQVRRLKTALRWKGRPEQRQRMPTQVHKAARLKDEPNFMFSIVKGSNP